MSELLRPPQDANITDAQGESAINLCANNYLGLANHPSLIEAAKQALDSHGLWAWLRCVLSAVRKPLHQHLEQRLAEFLGFQDAILYSSCFDANTGLFETLLDAQDAIISDSLNHASNIDGVRLCKAQRLRYANNDMQALEQQLQAAKDARIRLVVTDGVFSMDGSLANLSAVC